MAKKGVTLVLDIIDKKILSLLQVDASLSLNYVAERVNLTTTPCWKRIKRLDEIGVIRARVALLDAHQLGLSLTAFVQVKTQTHSRQWYSDFVATVKSLPEVMESYRMAGEYDYMMKVQVKDMAAFDQFYKKLVNSMDGLTDVTSSFAMEELKYTTELALPA